MERRKKRLARIRFWFRTIVLVSLITTVIVLLAFSSLFNIRRIEVNGNQHYSSEEIAKSTGITIGSNGFKSIGSSWKNIFTFRFGETEKTLLVSKPYIENVVVRFVPPGTVKVAMTERKPLAVISHLGNDVIVDKNGYALDVVTGEDNELPSISGLGVKSLKLGQAVEFETEKYREGFLAAVRLLLFIKESDDAIDTYKLFKLVDSVDAGNPKDIILGFDGRFKVKFGHLQDLEHNLNFFRHIYYSRLKNSNDKGILDMTVKKPVLMDETDQDDN